MWYRNGFGDCRMVGMYYCTMHHQMDLRTCAYKGQYWYNCTVTGTTLRTTHYASLSHHLAGHPTAFEIYCNRDSIHSDQTTDGQLAIYIYKRKDVGDTMDSTIRWKASIWFWPKTSSTWSEPITISIWITLLQAAISNLLDRLRLVILDLLEIYTILFLHCILPPTSIFLVYL